MSEGNWKTNVENVGGRGKKQKSFAAPLDKCIRMEESIWNKTEEKLM